MRGYAPPLDPPPFKYERELILEGTRDFFGHLFPPSVSFGLYSAAAAKATSDLPPPISHPLTTPHVVPEEIEGE